MSKFEGLPEHSQPSGGATPKSAATEALLPSAVLSAAADLIEPEGKWTQGYFAREADGAMCDANDTRAVCWCSVGAIERFTDDYDLQGEAEEYLAKIVGRYVPYFNDDASRTQAEVVAAFRAASELARSEGQ